MATATVASSATALMRGSALADAELVTWVRAGDDAAFATLFRRYNRRIAAYIYGLVRDFGRAEDITQDVFMSALRRMRETDREIVFKPWIYEIAKNACIDQYRRSRRAEEVSFDADDAIGAADQRRLAGAGPTPDAAVDQKLALDDLRGAIGGLSDTHRDILVMREFEGLSYSEIGRRMQLTRPAVESTLFRARRRLAEEYEELVSGARCARVQAIVLVAQTASLGARDRRKLAAHVAHCQPCRRHAVMAGIDPALLRTPERWRAKVAALLPLPLFLRRRLEDGDVAAVTPASTHVAQLSSQFSAMTDPALALYFARAAATAATIAVAAATAGLATHVVGGDSQARTQGTAVLIPPLVSQVVPATSHPTPAAKTSHRQPAPVTTTTRRRVVHTHASRTIWATSHRGGSAQPPSGVPAKTSAAANHPLGTLDNAVPATVPGGESARREFKRAVKIVVRISLRAAGDVLAPAVKQAQSTVDDARSTVDGLIPRG